MERRPLRYLGLWPVGLSPRRSIMLKTFLPLILCACLGQPPCTTGDRLATIHIYGDSIARGYGLADFDNTSPLNSIWGIGNLMLPDGSGYVFRYGVNEPIQDNSIWQAGQAGVIEPGDVVVFENAGPHFDNTEYYRMWLKLIRFQATHRGNDVRLLLTTTPDYQPKAPGFYNSNYDEIVDSGLSINDVVRQEAASADLLAWDAEMDRAMGIMAEYGATPMLADNVHPNAFGNLALAGSVLRKLEIDPANLDSVKAEFLDYRSQFSALFGFELTEVQTGEIVDRLAGN